MNFWKVFGASLLAIVVASVLSMVVFICFFVSLLFSFEFETEVVPEKSVLYINLSEDIIDGPTTSTMGVLDPSSLTFSQPVTILETLTAIENAAEDSRIKGICINCNGVGSVSPTNIEELRGALERFKESGKFVVAYDDMYTQSEYYLATAADQIILQPEGSLEWSGVGMSLTFFKGLMDKLDVDIEVFRPTECKYKSAVEPYIRTNMSAENREQMELITNSMWNDIVHDVAVSRGLNEEDLKRYAENLEIKRPEDALERGMIDRIAYEDEVYDLFYSSGAKRSGYGGPNAISLRSYVTAINLAPLRVTVGEDWTLDGVHKPLVAIIYADGQIVDGNMYMDGYVYGSRLAAELRQARLDSHTKAVVLRVNSPGGSALASDVVWREMTLLQQSKPVVISMGEMAASGGYYISAPADYIFANKLTLTGSIGVFGMMFNLEDTLKNKLGITIDTAATSPSAGGMTFLGPLTEAQRNYVKVGVDDVYTTFTSIVSEGRNLPIEDVYAIAEGRVWSGSNALTIGLVDEIGGFTHAVAKATQLAGISNNYTLYEFRAPLSELEQWIQDMGFTATVNLGFGNSYYFEDIKNLFIENPMLMTNGGIQAIVPGDMHIDL